MKLNKKNKVITNSLWGVFANIFQNIFLSVFFVIMARCYGEKEFASYIIANTIYSFVLGFSSLGLGYWFIREFINVEDKLNLIEKFFKIQLVIGFVFYLVNVITTFLFYKSTIILELSCILGLNIIFDNVIYVIKYLNIAEQEQKKSAVLLNVEALLKCVFAVSLFIVVIDIRLLSFVLILLRFLTLNLFIRYGSSNKINLRHMLRVKLDSQEMKRVILGNYSFVIIGSISIINLRIGNIIVSKFLPLNFVTYYEICFKLLSLVYIIPVIVAGSAYPAFLKIFKVDKEKIKSYFFKFYLLFAGYGLLCFTGVYSFSKIIIPILFGEKYANIFNYCSEMFLVMLVLPTLLLQANLLVVMGLEKIDMICNLVCLFFNMFFSFVGLYFFHTLSVVIYALFFSFLIFHIIQDFILVKKQVLSVHKVLVFYFLTFFIVQGYIYFSELLGGVFMFFLFWSFLFLMAFLIRKKILHYFNFNYAQSTDIDS